MSYLDTQVAPMTIDEITELGFGTELVRPIGVQAHPTDLRPRRRWLVAVAAGVVVLVLLGTPVWLLQMTDPDTSAVAPVVPSTVAQPKPTTVYGPFGDPPTSDCDAASTWSRVCDDAADFDGAAMWSIASGGPGLVAAGGEFGYSDELGFWTPEDIQPLLERGGDGDAVVWTSLDGTSWNRVPHDEAVFGGDGSQHIFSVTAGGPGLVAVGFDGTLDNVEGNAAVWTSPDGFTWSRVPHNEAVFGGEDWQVMFGVTAGGPGLVAVGLDGTFGVASRGEADAAVWTSPDGFTWTRVPHDESVFGGVEEQHMLSVTAGGPGLVAVGSDGHLDAEDDLMDPFANDAAVWTSTNGFAWTRVAHDEAVFGGDGGQRMLSVTVGGPGLVAVGSEDGDPTGSDAAVWISDDGVTWSRVPHDETVFGGSGNHGPKEHRMVGVTARDLGLVAVGWTGFDELGWDEAVWTSPDGITWTLLPQASTPDNGYVKMWAVTVGASGLVAVGEEHGGSDARAAVWNE
jgi:hypothetical protein